MFKTDVNPQMSVPRMGFVSAGLLFFIAISLFEIFTEQEHWPFCSYPMYSRVREDYGLTRLVVFGVVDDAMSNEKPLLRYRYLYPFDAARLTKNLAQLEKKPNRDQLFHAALKNIYNRYEKRRKKRFHDGPSLKEMKLYRVHWKLRTDLANLEAPEEKTLLSQYQPFEGSDLQ